MKRVLLIILAMLFALSAVAESTTIMARSPTIKATVDPYDFSIIRETEELSEGAIQSVLTVELDDYSDQTGYVRWRFIVGNDTITKRSRAGYSVTLTESDIDPYLPDGDVVTIYVSGSVETPGGLKEMNQYAVQFDMSQFGKGADMIEGTWRLITIERNRYYRDEGSAILVRNNGDKVEVIELYTTRTLFEDYKKNAISYRYENEANWWLMYEYEVFVETKENEDDEEIITSIELLGYDNYENDEYYHYNAINDEDAISIDEYIFDFMLRDYDDEMKFYWHPEAYYITGETASVNPDYEEEMIITLDCKYVSVDEANETQPYNMFEKIACGFEQD